MLVCSGLLTLKSLLPVTAADLVAVILHMMALTQGKQLFLAIGGRFVLLNQL